MSARRPASPPAAWSATTSSVPRVELEGVYRYNQHNAGFPGRAISNQVGQLGILANLLYDFSPASTITPYIGAGAGVAFVDGDSSLGSTQFAYQGIIGLGWNVDTNFRVNLDGRYYGTSNPSVGGSTWSNNNFSVMLGLQIKFGAPPPPPPPPAAGCRSRRRSWCSSIGTARTCRTRP